MWYDLIWLAASECLLALTSAVHWSQSRPFINSPIPCISWPWSENWMKGRISWQDTLACLLLGSRIKKSYRFRGQFFNCSPRKIQPIYQPWFISCLRQVMLSLKSAPARRRNGPRPPTGPKPMISTGFQRSIAAWIAWIAWIASCRSGGAAVAAGCHQPPATLSHVANVLIPKCLL